MVVFFNVGCVSHRSNNKIHHFPFQSSLLLFDIAHGSMVCSYYRGTTTQEEQGHRPCLTLTLDLGRRPGSCNAVAVPLRSISSRVFPYRTSYHHTIIQCKPNLNSSIQDHITVTNTRHNLLAWLVQQTEGLGDRDARMNQAKRIKRNQAGRE